MAGHSIEVQKLTKVFSSAFGGQKVTALNDVSLAVEPGTIFGLLGPNGAGKTTLIKVLLGIVYQTSGEAKILDTDVSNYEIRKRVGYLPENHKYPNYLTGQEIMRLFGRLSGVSTDLNKKIKENLELLGMLKWRKTKIRKYSKGMMQRLGLAQALLNDPDIIFLDEPTDGVDPLGRKEIRDILISLRESGKTIFLNSHLLSEVELISDRIAILNKGELIYNGNVDELTTDEDIYIIEAENEINGEIFEKIGNISKIDKREDKSLEMRISSVYNLNKIIDILREGNISILQVNRKKLSLEDMFISMVDDGKEGQNV